MNICIIGSGAWGTAMAIHLAKMNHTVTLVARNTEFALKLASTRENYKYLNGFSLDNNIQISCESGPALMEAEVVMIACPSIGLRNVCNLIKDNMEGAKRIKLVLSLCKGLEMETNFIPSKVIEEEISDLAIGSLSGPTYAIEVASGNPTAIVLASNSNNSFIKKIAASMSNHNLRVYYSQDLTGVELGGCLKNVYAIAAGICDGLKLGDNTKAALLTRSLHEMVKIGVYLNGKTETFYGLSGFGDLIATCNGKWSRNRTFGEKIVSAISISELVNSDKITVEGYRTTQCFFDICETNNLKAPILNEIHAILYHNKKPKDAIMELMNRDIKSENG